MSFYSLISPNITYSLKYMKVLNIRRSYNRRWMVASSGVQEARFVLFGTGRLDVPASQIWYFEFWRCSTQLSFSFIISSGRRLWRSKTREREHSDWYGEEGTTKCEAIDGNFANLGFTVWLSDTTKTFCNIVFVIRTMTYTCTAVGGEL